MVKKQKTETPERNASGQRKTWSKLDNAARVFPSTTSKYDTRVFRFSCQLKENIDPVVLQATLNEAIKEFPHFLCVLRRGMFWYYLEQTDETPIVTEENDPPCHEIYINGMRNLLFKVTYYKKRINLDVFHALTDGTGAQSFLQYIVWHYLYEMHKDGFDGEFPALDDISSAIQKANDSFTKYYSKDKEDKPDKAAKREKKSEAIKKAYNFKGEHREDDNILVLEAQMSVAKMLDVAHKYNTTLTGLLTALYIQAISKEMNVQSRKIPISIGIPVNLRRYFPSDTSRNFFYMTSVNYNVAESGGDFDEIVETVTARMKEQLNPENMKNGLNSYGNLTRNVAIRLAPLPLKDLILRIVRYFSDKKGTSVVSNIGAVHMPKALEQYIDFFTVVTATGTTQLTLCSFNDRLSLGFTSSFVNNEIIKNYIRLITDMDIDVTVFCNDFNEKTEAENAVL